MAEESGFDSRQGQVILLFPTSLRPALGPIQFSFLLVPRALPPEVKRPGREAGHSPVSSVEKCL
jgi:hypothetical protein